MAERRAVNKYYPPDMDPSKGSVNKQNKCHPLRARARKLDQGILVVRFAMPFNVWCLKCDNHIGMGVRYNAEKSKSGNYYSTPIYHFKMKCHLCDNYIHIETDPSKLDYKITEGARKQVIDSSNDDCEPTDDTQPTTSSGTNTSGNTDAMSRLENKVRDQTKAESLYSSLNKIINRNEQRKDSFAINQLVRSRYRENRKQAEKAKARDRDLLKRFSLQIRRDKSSKSS